MTSYHLQQLNNQQLQELSSRMKQVRLIILTISIVISISSAQEGGHDQPPDGGGDSNGGGVDNNGNGQGGNGSGFEQGFNRGIKPYSYGYNTGVKPYSYNFYQPLGGKKTEQQSGGEEDNADGKESTLKAKLNGFSDLIISENQRSNNQVPQAGAVYDEPDQDSNQDNDQKDDNNQGEENSTDQSNDSNDSNEESNDNNEVESDNNDRNSLPPSPSPDPNYSPPNPNPGT